MDSCTDPPPKVGTEIDIPMNDLEYPQIVINEIVEDIELTNTMTSAPVPLVVVDITEPIAEAKEAEAKETEVKEAEVEAKEADGTNPILDAPTALTSNAPFCLGENYSRCYSGSRKARPLRDRSQPSNKRQKTEPPKKGVKRKNQAKKSKPVEPVQPQPVDPLVRLAQMSRLVTDMSPFYTHALISRIVFAKPQEPLYDFSGKTKAGIVKIIIPAPKNHVTFLAAAHMRLQYFTGYIFEWEIRIAELAKEKPAFEQKSSLKFKFDKPTVFSTGSQVVKAARQLLITNQRVRWRFKWLVARWIAAKSRKRSIGADRDVNTLEPIPEEDQVKLVCMKTRCEYVFSGSALQKSVRACLEAQNMSIPSVKAPQNPFNNLPFTYGQMLEVYHQLLGWCFKKRKTIPSIIALYRETGFRPGWLQKIHHNFIQYRATHTYMRNDDTTNEFFLDNLENMLETYEQALHEFPPEILTKQRFRFWLSKDPTHYLLKCWRFLVGDFWYYEQTTNLVREHWRSDGSIINDIIILLKASESKLRNLLRDYR
jgi:hypothetical protein